MQNIGSMPHSDAVDIAQRALHLADEATGTTTIYQELPVNDFMPLAFFFDHGPPRDAPGFRKIVELQGNESLAAVTSAIRGGI